MNIDPVSAPPDPAAAIRPRPPARPDPDERLDERLVESALASGRDRRGGRATRGDGWTPQRIRIFLVTLADCGCVTTAAGAAGISVRSAYNLRNRAEGRAFHIGWEAALQLAKRRLADSLMARAMHGCVDQIRKDGEIVAERCRFDNRLSMATLTRLDQRAAASSAEAEAVRIVTEEFDSFVAAASASGAGGAEFIASRRQADPAPEAIADPWAHVPGVPASSPMIDISDIDPAKGESWTADQRDRARRAGLIDLPSWRDPAQWNRGSWPDRIPEAYGPLIAAGLCFPMARTDGRVWISFGGKPASPGETSASSWDSDGNDELREL